MLSLMSLTSVAAATGILSNAMKLLDSVREQAKGSKDLALKENISNLYNDLLDLKAAHIRIEEENAELRRQIAQATHQPPVPKIRQVGAVNYYFVPGEEEPYCQPCYDGKLKSLVRVSPPETWNGGQRRHCPVCHIYFQETKSTDGPVRLGGRRGWTWS
jgi:hypothetical protein